MYSYSCLYLNSCMYLYLCYLRISKQSHYQNSPSCLVLSQLQIFSFLYILGAYGFVFHLCLSFICICLVFPSLLSREREAGSHRQGSLTVHALALVATDAINTLVQPASCHRLWLWWQPLNFWLWWLCY